MLGDPAVRWESVRSLVELGRSGVEDAMRTALPSAVPLTVFLPEADLAEMVGEILGIAQDSEALGDLTPMAVLQEHWRHSDEIYAALELLRLITAEPEEECEAVMIMEDDK